jgi:hypothetical protein
MKLLGDLPHHDLIFNIREVVVEVLEITGVQSLAATLNAYHLFLLDIHEIGMLLFLRVFLGMFLTAKELSLLPRSLGAFQAKIGYSSLFPARTCFKIIKIQLLSRHQSV